MADYLIPILPLLLGWGADLLFGDPVTLPHPIVWFGRLISFCEHHLNHGAYRKLKGALMGIGLVMLVYVVTYWLIRLCGSVHISLKIALEAILIFYCLAGTTLIREVREVFRALDRSLEEGRVQVGRIVGRDTSELSAQEIRTAALETLAENLSDGVIAPLFWYALLGVPGMMAYKMVNTLDSMVGYHSERYLQFGCIPARVDDVANYIPARLTALLMLLVAGRLDLLSFVWKYGPQHASPNSGYPESALAGILDCRFGGPHYYFGELFDKPYIGNNPRELTTADMEVSVKVNRKAEVAMVVLVILCLILVP
ncbi:MAG: cobalamin biosynthesis protein CobD [Bacteroidaceae bacterium]|nr:cobalamin biosynthesis protein CobD [Bacteroidaceae bacterium]